MSDLRSRLSKLIESAGFDPQPYSGRGMYGEHCLSFTCYLYGVADKEMHKVLRGLRRDQMGKGYVIYFPAVSAFD